MVGVRSRFFDFALLLVLLTALVAISALISSRPSWVGTDTPAYLRLYYAVNDGAFVRVADFAFVSLIRCADFIWGGYPAFFFLVSFIGFSGVLLAGLLFRFGGLRDGGSASEYLVLLSGLMLFSPFFANTQINIIRHGVAVPFVVLAYWAFNERRWLISFLCSMLAVGFHSAMLMHVMLLPLLFLRVNVLYFIVFLLSGSYLLGLSSTITSPVAVLLNVEDVLGRLENLGQWSSYRSGIRIDFWMFSIAILGMVRLGVLSKALAPGFEKFAIIALFPFLIFGYIAYSDRFLVTLWALVPLIFAGFAVRYIRLAPGGGLIVYFFVFLLGVISFLHQVDFLMWRY